VELIVGKCKTGNVRVGSHEDERVPRPSRIWFSEVAGEETADGVGAGGDAGVRRRRSQLAPRSGSATVTAGDALLLYGAAEMHVGGARQWRRSESPTAAAAAPVVGAGVSGGAVAPVSSPPAQGFLI